MDIGISAYVYDVNGNLTTAINAKGNTYTFTYDALNRLVKEYEEYFSEGARGEGAVETGKRQGVSQPLFLSGGKGEIQNGCRNAQEQPVVLL